MTTVPLVIAARVESISRVDFRGRGGLCFAFILRPSRCSESPASCLLNDTADRCALKGRRAGMHAAFRYIAGIRTLSMT